MSRAFTLLHKLGEGAYGAVHLAEVHGDEGFVQTVAVKWLHARWSADPELAGRLRDEARLLGLLNHDHIVRVHGLTRLEDRLAVLMEPVDGADLSRVGAIPVPPQAALEIASAVADALDAAWRHTPPGTNQPLKVVHRDIKPSNVMVTTRGGVKVMDFGVARATFDAREADTRSQQFGTARYMAPERWLEGIAEAPSDVFSLGVTLWELLTGTSLERPRLSRGGFEHDVAEALEQLGPADDPLRTLVAEMLAFEPESRPTAESLVRRCLDLVDVVPGPSLRQWARDWVPRHQQRPASATETAVIQEDPGGMTFDNSTSAVPLTAPVSTLSSPTAPNTPTSPTTTSDLKPIPVPTTEVDKASLVASRRTGIMLGVSLSLGLLAVLATGWTLFSDSGDTPTPNPLASADPEPPEPPLNSDAAITDDPPTSDNSPSPAEVASAAPSTEAELTEAAPAEPTAPAVAPPPRRPPAPTNSTASTDASAGANAKPPSGDGTADAEPEEPPVEAALPESFVTFMASSGDLRITGPQGPIPTHRAVAQPQGVLPIQIQSGAGTFTCSVLVGPAPASFRIDGTTQKCTRAQ